MRTSNKKARVAVVCTVVILSLCLLLYLPAKASASSSGASFDHTVIIAMENQYYGSVIGCGSCAPFINSVLVPAGSTISNYHSYGQNIGGCSAGCYEAFTAGQQHVSDGWCPKTSSPCVTEANIADQLHTAGLTSAMFCEDGCPRSADHFPWIGYTSTWNSCVTGGFNCNGQTGPDGNLLYGSTSSNSASFSSVTSDAGNTAFINYLNSGNPANYIWFTPSDNHNMHANSVSTGDNYLHSLLVGNGGTLSNPNAGTVLSTNLFKQPGTFLYIWWDEYDPSPNIEYGSMIKAGYTSTGGYDEYSSLHTIEANWGLPYLTNVVSSDPSMSDLFGSGSSGLSASFSINPSSPPPGRTITFTGSASGGTEPYTYSWNFGDGTTTTGPSPTHSYTRAGIYTVTMKATDGTGKTGTKTQQVSVGQTSFFGLLTSLFSTLWFVMVGLIVGGAAAVTILLLRHHGHNVRTQAKMSKEL